MVFIKLCKMVCTEISNCSRTVYTPEDNHLKYPTESLSETRALCVCTLWVPQDRHLASFCDLGMLQTHIQKHNMCN